MTLPEYYLTRTELKLLESIKDEVALLTGKQQLLIEPGAGNCQKVKALLPVIQPKCYMPIDISAEFIFFTAAKLQLEFPKIDIQATAADMQMSYPVLEKYKQLKKQFFIPVQLLVIINQNKL